VPRFKKLEGHHIFFGMPATSLTTLEFDQLWQLYPMASKVTEVNTSLYFILFTFLRMQCSFLWCTTRLNSCRYGFHEPCYVLPKEVLVRTCAELEYLWEKLILGRCKTI
jgi:hypothetical protein